MTSDPMAPATEMTTPTLPSAEEIAKAVDKANDEVSGTPQTDPLKDEEAKRRDRVIKELAILQNYAKSNCKKCFGRGHSGINLTTNTFQPCTCAMNALEKERNDKHIKESLFLIQSDEALQKEFLELCENGKKTSPFLFKDQIETAAVKVMMPKVRAKLFEMARAKKAAEEAKTTETTAEAEIVNTTETAETK